MSFELRPYQLDAEQQAPSHWLGVSGAWCCIVDRWRQDVHGDQHHHQGDRQGQARRLCGESQATGRADIGRPAPLLAGYYHLQAENTCRLDARVLVASIDTIHVRGLPDDVGLIVIDECHGVAGSQKYERRSRATTSFRSSG